LNESADILQSDLKLIHSVNNLNDTKYAFKAKITSCKEVPLPGLGLSCELILSVQGFFFAF
jgi:hypothetical protein